MKKLSALSLALLLTACGSSSDGPSPSTGVPVPPVNPSTPAPVVTDSFTSRVLDLIGLAPDDADDSPVDGVVLTTPDDTEPVAPG